MSLKFDSANKSNKIDAAEAQIESLISIQEALKRENEDLVNKSEDLDEEKHMLKAELL